jgi:hypothetical protein
LRTSGLRWSHANAFAKYSSGSARRRDVGRRPVDVVDARAHRGPVGREVRLARRVADGARERDGRVERLDRGRRVAAERTGDAEEPSAYAS